MKVISNVPNLFPNEHFLSRLARMMLLSQSKSLKSFQRENLGLGGPINPQRVYEAIYEQSLRLTQEQDREGVFLNHTATAFYSHFLPLKTRRTLFECPKTNNPPMPFIYGLTKLRHSNAWRHCPVCREEDINKVGTSYWHVCHQLPTTLTCDRHPQQGLISDCSGCGWKHSDLSEWPLPLKQCPVCSQPLMSDNFVHNEVTRWVQDKGLRLFFEATSIEKPKFEYSMTRGVSNGFIRYVNGRAQESWKLADELQNQFYEWFLKHELNRFFVPLDAHSFSYLLSLVRTHKTPRRVNPLSHLFWTAYLLGIGESGHQLSLAS